MVEMILLVCDLTNPRRSRGPIVTQEVAFYHLRNILLKNLKYCTCKMNRSLSHVFEKNVRLTSDQITTGTLLVNSIELNRCYLLLFNMDPLY